MSFFLGRYWGTKGPGVVFVPAFFMVGAARAMFLPLSLAVGFAMVCSYLLSSTLVPILSVWLLRGHEHGAAGGAPGSRFARLPKGYGKLVERLVRRLRGLERRRRLSEHRRALDQHHHRRHGGSEELRGQSAPSLLCRRFDLGCLWHESFRRHPLASGAAHRDQQGGTRTTFPLVTSHAPTEAPATLLSDGGYHLFHEGSHHHLWEKLGSPPVEPDGVSGTLFAVWAPTAATVSVVGDWNGWNDQSDVLQARGTSGIWEGFVPGARQGTIYKYFVRGRHAGYTVEKADPYAIHAENAPKTGSIVWDLVYSWNDGEWMANRGSRASLPMARPSPVPPMAELPGSAR